jgi:hypothetical protein
VILITTANNQLDDTIPTEIGQLTGLVWLYLCKYEGCVRSFHAPIAAGLSSHMKTAFSPFGQFTTTPSSFIAILSIFVILITTDNNQLAGTIPTEIGQLTGLEWLYLCKYEGCVRSFHALFFIYTHYGLCCVFYLFLEQMITI